MYSMIIPGEILAEVKKSKPKYPRLVHLAGQYCELRRLLYMDGDQNQRTHADLSEVTCGECKGEPLP